tara:strand:+ start:2998 stop:3609 length:612 start_codon:yes stop_codon:yes gene_type:complete
LNAQAAPDPQELIIEAAERLLATDGPQKATVRAITEAAGVNVAAVNYHFGSRDGLMTVICARHMRPANNRILERLQQVDRAQGIVSVKAIFAPLVSTALTVWMHDDVLKGLRDFIFVDAELVQKLNVTEMSDVYQQMQDALAEACPALAPEQVRRRFSFAMATIMQVVRSHEFKRAPDEAGLIEELLTYVAGGFAADTGEEER